MAREMDHVWLTPEEFQVVATWYDNRTKPIQFYMEPVTKDIIVRCEEAAMVIKRSSNSQTALSEELAEQE
jgi:hypothetical protein